MSTEYKRYANNNAFLNKTLYPARGSIYDRKGKLLVFNQPAYDVLFVPRQVTHLDTMALCKALSISKAYFVDRMKEVKDRRHNPGFSNFTPQSFMTQLSPEEVGVFHEKLFYFPGFYVQRRFVRKYTYNVAAHLLGNIGEVSPREVKKDPYYISGDFIGKQGIEKQYETILRGEKGSEILLRDAHGRIQGKYEEGAFDVAPVHGKDLSLGLDIELQLLGERLMKNKIGSIVAIEPSTGEILCMVSSPTFNPNSLVGHMRSRNYRKLQQDHQKPLLNRSIMGTYPPGSTFKTAQGLVYLNEGIITKDTQFPCSHGFTYGSLHVGCHAHPAPLSLIPAIGTSCNSYFCWGLFRMIGSNKYRSPSDALTIWKDDMVSMGFGYRLGIDLPGEKRGFIPNAAYYNSIYRGSWNGLTIISIAIGQGEILLTPLQIANLGATIANRGSYITPHVVHAVKDQSLDSLYTTKKTTSISPRYYEDIIDGMRLAVTGGTCRRANLPDIEVCGKTGTAQNRGHDHSVFMGFAPKTNPKISVAVYVENGGYGAVYGVPIGALLMEQYLKGTLSEKSIELAEQISNRTIYYGDEKR